MYIIYIYMQIENRKDERERQRKVKFNVFVFLCCFGLQFFPVFNIYIYFIITIYILNYGYGVHDVCTLNPKPGGHHKIIIMLVL